MLYIPPADFKRATQITLLEYLQACMPDELIQQGRDYITRTHDSLVLSENGLWDWKSRGIHRAAIDTLTRASADYKRSPHFWAEKHYLSTGGASILDIDQ